MKPMCFFDINNMKKGGKSKQLLRKNKTKHMSRRIVVMGVASCGKSTVGREIAEKIGAQFFEGDDFHPPQNIAKMKSGMPLDDDDREPWLEALACVLSNSRREGRFAVLSCSALKRKYRDILRSKGDPDLSLVFLSCKKETVASRMSSRSHFFPMSLLDSQFSTLEPPQDDEEHVKIDAEEPVSEIVSSVLTRFNSEKFPGTKS